MLLKAYAKINISLDVIGKREDGYHLLRMIMQTIDLYDTIEFRKIDKGIEIQCNKKFVPCNESNIAYKAAKKFIDTYNINGGIEIILNKNIPVAAGLAGGSTDAAAVLKAMRRIYSINVSDEDIMKLGLSIGADVPYCVRGGTALCEGIGEVIRPIKSFRNNIIVLVKPPFGVSTKEVYKNIDINKIIRHPDTNAIIQGIESKDIFKVCNNMRNVLENVTLRKHRILRHIKDQMMERGALTSLMSGSGPTIFGVFDDMLKAQLCFEMFKKHYKEVYITRTI